MNPRTHLARPMAVALIALTAALTACTNYDPRFEPPTPVPSAAVTAAPTAAATAAATVAATPAPIGSAHVVLTTATSAAVTIDVKDDSRTLISAKSGTPGDGASVEAYKLIVTNVTPTTLRLTWLGGPCDSANSLAIDAARRQLVLVQPECPGDAIATDRILDLSFSTAVKAGDFETSLQDGLDT